MSQAQERITSWAYAWLLWLYSFLTNIITFIPMIILISILVIAIIGGNTSQYYLQNHPARANTVLILVMLILIVQSYISLRLASHFFFKRFQNMFETTVDKSWIKPITLKFSTVSFAIPATAIFLFCLLSGEILMLFVCFIAIAIAFGIFYLIANLAIKHTVSSLSSKNNQLAMHMENMS